jgi:hypothetical protein
MTFPLCQIIAWTAARVKLTGLLAASTYLPQSEIMPKVQLSMRLIIMCQTRRWITKQTDSGTGYKLSGTGDQEYSSEIKECLC